jgi:hypothetical protein
LKASRRTKSHLINGKLSLAVGSRHGTSLIIAQRFNAGCDNEMKIESGEGRKKRSVVPMGLDKEECLIPSVKTLGYCRYGTEYYEMACSSPSAG